MNFKTENMADNSASLPKKSRNAAIGSILAALAASTCCILPLLLFSAGLSGAWLGQLTSLAPYQPIFIAAAFGFIGYGYWMVRKAEKAQCEDGAACAKPLPNRLVKTALWASSLLVLVALAWQYIVPFIFE